MSAPVRALARRKSEITDFDRTRSRWTVEIATRDGLYYELIEDTLHPEFYYRYFVIRDAGGEARGVQPFFLIDQDLLVGLGSRLTTLIGGIRKLWPRFMRARVLMVGCVAGEGHLDGEGTCDRRAGAVVLHRGARPRAWSTAYRP